MTFNPYIALGLHPSAAHNDIRAAYHKLCMTLHPDHGGGTEEMTELNRAYDLLSDPEKRRKYDEMGITEDNGDATIKQLNDLFIAVMSVTQVTDIDHTDILGKMRTEIENKKRQVGSELHNLTTQRDTQAKALEKVKKRMKAKKQNFLIVALENAMKLIEVPINNLEAQIAMFKQMLVLLEDFEYEFEVIEPVQHPYQSQQHTNHFGMQNGLQNSTSSFQYKGFANL